MNKSKLQLLIEDMINSLLSVFKIFILSKFYLSLPKRNYDQCVILANGPSLTGSIKTGQKLFENKDLICVNNFAETEYYKQLKPVHYILISPELYRPDVVDFLKHKRERLFNAITQNTQWPINLFIPSEARKYKEWKSIIQQNKNINICYFNTTPIEGLQSITFFLFRKNMGMPRPHNVLIPSIFLSCNLAYEKIYLLGVDHSWLKEIWVTDQNRVLLTQKHFYDEKEAKPMPMNRAGKGERKLFEVLQKFVYAFRGYIVLEEYAKKNDVHIINLTPGSYIDAFERMSINDLSLNFSK